MSASRAKALVVAVTLCLLVAGPAQPAAAWLPPQADLSITKTDSPDPVAPGTNLTYTIQVANAGPDAAMAVSLMDTIPSGTSFVSLSAPAGWTCATPSVS